MCIRDRYYVYRIEGELSNLEDQTVYAVFEKDNYKVVDTVVCTKPGPVSYTHLDVYKRQ